MSVCLTIRDKPASPSRDEDVKLKGCGSMELRLQLGHPTFQGDTITILYFTAFHK